MVLRLNYNKIGLELPIYLLIKDLSGLTKVGGLVGKIMEVDERARFRFDYVRLKIAFVEMFLRYPSMLKVLLVCAYLTLYLKGKFKKEMRKFLRVGSRLGKITNLLQKYQNQGMNLIKQTKLTPLGLKMDELAKGSHDK